MLIESYKYVFIFYWEVITMVGIEDPNMDSYHLRNTTQIPLKF